MSNYVAPTNDTEEVLCEIYANVLGLEKSAVGIEDDFFRLGGNSILAIKLLYQINENFSSNINISVVLSSKTINQLADRISRERGYATNIRPYDVEKVEERILSFAQERIWFIDNYEGGSNIYNIPLLFKLAEHVDIECLSKAIKDVVNRHEILHSQIKIDYVGNSYQAPIDSQKNPFCIDLLEIIHSELDSFLLQDASYIFDLSSSYPLKVKLYKTEDSNYYLSVIVHHIAFDGWSVDILIKEVLALYQYYIYYSDIDKDLPLDNLRIQYKDYALWQRSYLTGKVLDEQVDFWKQYLDGYTPLSLPTDKSRPAYIQYEGRSIPFIVDESTSNQLRHIAKQSEVSLFSLLLSAYYLMLSAYSNQKDLIVGTPFSNRHYKEIANIIGCFVNTLPLRYSLDTNNRIVDFVKEVSELINKVQIFQDLPFEKLVDLLKIDQDPSRSPLFQVMFTLQSFGISTNREESESLLNEYYPNNSNGYSIAKYDLTTTIDDSDRCIKGDFTYAISLFEEETISLYIDTYLTILNQICLINNEDLKVKDIQLINARDYNLIVNEWNSTRCEYPQNETIISLFEKQAELTPDNIAIDFAGATTTYRELWIKVNELSSYISYNYNIKENDAIVLCLDRSELMIISLLAILQTGAAYVPVSPNYPDERIAFILADTKTKLVLTNSAHLNKVQRIQQGFKDFNISIESLDNENFNKKIKGYNIDNKSPNKATPKSVAYIMYTSGTTGMPKGVTIEHRSFLNLIYYYRNEHFYNETNINTYSITNYVFDIWGLEYGLTLLSGGFIEISDSNFDKINTSKYTFIQMTPSLLSVAYDKIIFNNKNLILLVGGEAINEDLLRKILHDNEIKSIINVYGPTETTVWSTNKINTKNDWDTSIGKPISNTSVYILDDQLRLLPIRAIGELYIGGVGVSKGYLNRPDLTNERFIKNPYQSETDKEDQYNERIYKTGDLVRYTYNGNIEYVGRNDFQVKIRGHRIELGEIEACISNIEGIRQAVVLTHEHETGGKYLVAYYTSEQEIDLGIIKEYVEKHLPEYMVPPIIIHLGEFPLTVNGKLDRKRLPKPNFVGNNEYIAPQNNIEKLLCFIYSEVLGIDVEIISVKDSFFKLGGNSILAIKLVSVINKKAKTFLTVSDIFRYKTIIELSEKIQHKEYSNKHPIGSYNIENQVLSFSQERIWFIESFTGGSNVYNIPIILKIKNGIKVETLIKSLYLIVDRHEILRTRIKVDFDGNTFQELINGDKKIFKIEITPLNSELELENEINKEINIIFDLCNDYPLRIRFLKVLNDTYLSIVVHHIAFDGWSTDILLKELLYYYNEYESSFNKDIVPLPCLNIQYKDYAYWQKHIFEKENYEKQLEYWINKLRDYEPLNLPTDRIRSKDIDYRGNNISFAIDGNTSKSLRNLARNLDVSLYSVLLAGYYLMLYSYSNQKDITIGSPVANRHYEGISDLIGCFVNTICLRQLIKPDITLSEFIKQVGKIVIEAQQNQDLPFEKLVEEMNIEKNPSKQPIFQVMFSVQSFGTTGHSSYDKLFNIIDNNQFKVSKFDITTILDDSEESIKGYFEYSINLFDDDTIRAYIETYRVLLIQLAELETILTFDRKISDLDLIHQSDYNKIITDWNRFRFPLFTNKNIVNCFEEQVRKEPNKIALKYLDKTLTYGELNSKSNNLASYLKQISNIKQDDLVAIYLDRSELMVISILAILKSGGAYVPISREYPIDRIIYILKEANCKTLITEKNDIDTILDSIDIPILDINQDILWENLQSSNLDLQISPSSLAYVMFTSGTTGKPKGVMVEHKSIVNLTKHSNYLEISSEDNVLGLSNFAFDGSTYDFFVPLLNGATLIVGKKDDLLDIDILKGIIQNENISNMFLTTALFNFIIDENIDCFTGLKYIIIGGERASVLHTQIFKKKYKETTLVNGYGPTECTTFSTTYKIEDSNSEDHSVSIGRHLTNLTTYVLNESMQPVPQGGIGELYIGGLGVSRGYLNNVQLTSEKFLLNPFCLENEESINKIIYKSGDLVRYLKNGDIEYIGRNDQQVKIRGHRIELEEVSNNVLKLSDIKQTFVTVKRSESNLDIIVAYYTSNHIIDNELIKSFLKKRLPEYMIPSLFIFIKEFPTTSNGKIDIKALPEPILSESITHEPPSNLIETKLCYILSEMLNIDDRIISMNNDFFDLGGNSILAIKLTNLIYSNFGCKIRVVDIFIRTIRELAQIINEDMDAFNPIVKFPSLKNTLQDRSIFMIHPGFGGCEVYRDLANKINGIYNCYGVDSYNLNNPEELMTSLNDLAAYYLKYINKYQYKDNYILLGWSLGGLISLEIAYLLEKKGVRDIIVLLLDTTVNNEDDLIVNLKKSLLDQKHIEVHLQGENTNYLTKYCTNVEELSINELKLGSQLVSTKLKYTRIILFKAMKDDETLPSHLNEHIANLKYNNVDKIIYNLQQIYCVNVENASHNSIIEESDLIMSIIENLDMRS
ncbi:MAG: amino acid adenylation domain-containing protein [Prevotella sp.]|nr:amino acid adenylation domain-containing protein [Prevotella sp.]